MGWVVATTVTAGIISAVLWGASRNHAQAETRTQTIIDAEAQRQAAKAAHPAGRGDAA